MKLVSLVTVMRPSYSLRVKDVESKGYVDDPKVGLSYGPSMTTNEADNSREPPSSKVPMKLVSLVTVMRPSYSLRVKDRGSWLP